MQRTNSGVMKEAEAEAGAVGDSTGGEEALLLPCIINELVFFYCGLVFSRELIRKRVSRKKKKD